MTASDPWRTRPVLVDRQGGSDCPFCSAAPGSPPDAPRGEFALSVEDDPAGMVWRTQQPIITSTVSELKRWPRTDLKLPFLRVAADSGGFAIDLPQSWLEENPLSADALESEADHWKAVGMKLEVGALSEKKVSVLKQVR